jgi:hypothetical protein
MPILKSANKIKIQQYLTKLRPFLGSTFFSPGFTDFERAKTLLLVKIFLNSENGIKAHSKLFLKLTINFLFQ